jgi:toxin ParE1/3/4
VPGRILVSPQADHDLEAVTNYYLDEEGLDLALRFARAVEQSFALLLSQPDMGNSAHFKKDLLQSVRWFPVGTPFQKYLIFYRRVNEDLEVIRLLHASRGIQAMLDES